MLTINSHYDSKWTVFYLLLYYNKRLCNGQSQILFHDASRQQRAGRGSVEGGVSYWSPCSNMVPCQAPAQTERELQSSPCDFAQTTWTYTHRISITDPIGKFNSSCSGICLWSTWSVWGATWEHEAACGPSVVSVLQLEPPASNKIAAVCLKKSMKRCIIYLGCLKSPRKAENVHTVEIFIVILFVSRYSCKLKR